MAPVEKKRQQCEVYSRVTGFITPVRQWNDAKKSEFNNRKTFEVCDCQNQ